MNRREFSSQEIRTVGGKGSRVIRLRVTDETLDRYKTVLLMEGWELSNFQNNSPFLWAHMSAMPPIGTVEDLIKADITVERAERGKMKIRGYDADVRFAKKKTSDFADMIHRLYLERIMRATSVGFNIIEKPRPATDEEAEKFGISEVDREEARILPKNELLEISAVPIPGNQNAVKSLRSIVGTKFGNWIEDPMSGLTVPEYFADRLQRIWSHMQGKAEEPEDWRALKQQIQTVIFSKDEWDEERARKWLSDHDFKSDKIDETEESLRFRQIDPDRCKGGFQNLTKNLPKGVILTACDVEGSDEKSAPKTEETESLEDIDLRELDRALDDDTVGRLSAALNGISQVRESLAAHLAEEGSEGEGEEEGEGEADAEEEAPETSARPFHVDAVEQLEAAKTELDQVIQDIRDDAPELFEEEGGEEEEPEEGAESAKTLPISEKVDEIILGPKLKSLIAHEVREAINRELEAVLSDDGESARSSNGSDYLRSLEEEGFEDSEVLEKIDKQLS